MGGTVRTISGVYAKSRNNHSNLKCLSTAHSLIIKGAFNAPNCTTLGHIIGLFLSPSMIQRVVCLYFNAKGQVVVDGVTGPEFNLMCGVRQGCSASPSFLTVALVHISWSYRLASPLYCCQCNTVQITIVTKKMRTHLLPPS